MDFIDSVIQSFPMWAQWTVSWGMRLNPSYEWFCQTENCSEYFTSDKFRVKARQIRWGDWRQSHTQGYYGWIRRRGIIIEFTVEDVLMLREMDAYDRVHILKSILHQAIQQASHIYPGMLYPVFHKPIAWEIGDAVRSVEGVNDD